MVIVGDDVRRFFQSVNRQVVPRAERPDLGPCWLWTGVIQKGGYGRFSLNRKYVGAHRWSYEHHVGPIPKGLTIDHLCFVPACVNPAHLEPVTQGENNRRAAMRQTQSS